MKILKIEICLIFTLLLTACDKSIKGQEEELSDYVSDHRVGDGSDYWLEKYAYYGEWIKVALIFGWANDELSCQRLAKIESKERGIPLNELRCTPAN